MYHKVFISSVEVAFSNTPIRGFEPLKNWPTPAEFPGWIAALRNTPTPRKIWVPTYTGSRWKFFKDYHQRIIAAGGLVINEAGYLLVIHRLGMWDLPKGKMEENENPRETALREVEEECGITGLEVVEELPATYHTYPHKGREVLKHTHWFLMRYRGTLAPTPQTEEDISEVKFMPPEEVAEAVKNTYESLMPLFEVYLLKYKTPI